LSELHLLTAAEVPLLLPLIRQFFAEGNIPGKLNEPYAVSTLQKHLQVDSGFVIAAGCPIRGAICGVMFPDMATAEPCAIEFFWYCMTEERGSLGIRLLDAFEKEAFRRGAARVMMSHLSTPKTQRFESMYARRGYVKREQIFMKTAP